MNVLMITIVEALLGVHALILILLHFLLNSVSVMKVTLDTTVLKVKLLLTLFNFITFIFSINSYKPNY